MEFDLRQLDIFRRVVELKSYSKAAESVHLAQASVSERMATLERSVGTKLLDHIGREVIPTRAGELLYKRAIKLLELKRQTGQELEDFLGIRKGDIDIGGSTIPAEYILPSVIKRFCEKYPDITVRLHISDSEAISRKVLGGMLEFGVVGSILKAKRLLYTKLWNDEMVLVVHPSHRWTRKRMIPLKDLSVEPFIQRETGSGTRQIVEQQLRRMHLDGFDGFNIVSQMGSSTAVKEAIKNGLGVSILSRKAVAADMEAGNLSIVQLDKVSLQRHFYLVHDRGRSQSPLCRALLEFLQSDAAESSLGSVQYPS